MRYIITLDLLARSKNDAERLLKGLRIVACQEVLDDQDAATEIVVQRTMEVLKHPVSPDAAAEVVRNWHVVPRHLRDTIHLQRWLDGGAA